MEATEKTVTLTAKQVDAVLEAIEQRIDFLNDYEEKRPDYAGVIAEARDELYAVERLLEE